MTGPDATETPRKLAALLRPARKWLVKAGFCSLLIAFLPRGQYASSTSAFSRRASGKSAGPFSAAACRAPASAAGGFEVLHEFSSGAGNPGGKLLQTADGKLYGTSSTGGIAGFGSVFVLTPSGGGFTFATLHSFQSSDGEFVTRGLVQGEDGNFYGVTYGGGANSVGTVFKITPSGALTTLHAFAASEGFHPLALIAGNDGNFYGTTQAGGSGSGGSVFKITPAGSLTTLHDFDASEGTSPGELIQASDGKFYGTTQSAGPGDKGTVFQMTLVGALTILHGFSGSDGASPVSLIQASDGNFYGTTTNGGGSDNGTVFRLTPPGVLTTVYSFSGSDGSFPVSLIQAAAGDFFGTTSAGGSAGDGTVFRITLPGSFATVYTFVGTDGRLPTAVIEAADGDLYGTTLFDGPAGNGTVFRLTVDGSLTNLETFLNTEGNEPIARLIQATDGNLYGTAYGNPGMGSVFRIDTSGTLTPLHTFLGDEGSHPLGGVIEGTDGGFYGTTQYGGENDKGTVFRVSSAGVFSALHSFADTDGASPHAGVIQADDGNFYGTTSEGGQHGFGTVFRMTPAGTVTTLLDFANDTDGAFPQVSLVQATDGNFYGTTLSGGAGSQGTVFRITSSGTLSTLFSFDLGADGGNPFASLIQAADGNFYGTTAGGGAGGFGTVFRITPSGTLTTLHGFTGADGSSALAELIQAPDGNFYGTTETGGENDDGTVFRVTPSGVVTTLHSFAGNDGNAPFAGLLRATDGNLYGSTINGGSGRGGVIFRLSGACLPPLAGNNGPICEGQTLRLTASDVAGATYSWTGPGGFTSAEQNPQIPSAAPSASGLYSVTITVGGCASAPATTSVVVHPLPSAAISAPASICPGSSGSASVPSAGAGATYGWSITNGTITSGAGTGAITFTAGGSGLVELDVTVTDVNGCGASGSTSVTIALPAECGSRNLIPDGRAVRNALVPAGSLYRGVVVAGRSYCIEVETPFDGLGTLGNGGPLPALAVTRSDGVTAVVASATTSCEPAAAARLSFTPTADDVSGGPLQFSVSDASAGGYPIRVRLTETTMFCPRWSVNGYTALISLQDTSDCPVSGKVLLLDSSGVPLTTMPFSLLPGGAVQLAVPSGLPAVFGSAILTHDGPPEAIAGGIYMAQPSGAAGANFRWPFRETRSGASSDGR